MQGTLISFVLFWISKSEAPGHTRYMYGLFCHVDNFYFKNFLSIVISFYKYVNPFFNRILFFGDYMSQ